eukprot:COSAG01_NODE_45215_length_411_cov_1.105769_1_plen_33_part_10
MCVVIEIETQPLQLYCWLGLRPQLPAAPALQCA